MPYYRYPRPCPARRNRGTEKVPGPVAAPASGRVWGICRVAGQPGGNGSPLALTLGTRQGDVVRLAPGGLSLILEPGRPYLVSLLVRGTPEQALSSFDQGSFTVTPQLDASPVPALAAGTLLPTEGGPLPVSVSATFLLPPADGPVSLSLLAECAGAGAAVARLEGTVSVLGV